MRFAGPIPAVRYYPNREQGIKARDKYREQGFHVLLHKVALAEVPDDRSKKPEESKRSNNKFLAGLTDRFRRKARSGGK